MSQTNEMPNSWKGIRNAVEAKQLIDMGVLLSWKEMKQIDKVFDEEQQKEIIRHFAVRFAERVESRLSAEILIESLLVWLANGAGENVLNCFLEEVLLQANQFEATSALVELALTSEVSDLENAEEIFAMAVALICELGMAIRQIRDAYPAEFKDSDKLLDHIATYLLSVSNSSNNCIRLSLIHYFGVMEQGVQAKHAFNRIMGRFGHTILEHLFTLLFSKKTEAIALQFLLENTPYILEADNHSQKILHETWKYYMLKKPERFALFIQTFSKYLQMQPKEKTRLATKTFLQHLGLLFKIASEVNHRDLGREVTCAIITFDNDDLRRDLVGRISNDNSIRASFKELIVKAGGENETSIDDISTFRSSKRGRKPSFARADDMKPMQQVNFLGTQQVARAS